MEHRTRDISSDPAVLSVIALGLLIGFGAFFVASVPVRWVAFAADRTTKDGVYSDPQAQRGKTQYTQTCAVCHMEDLSGNGSAPPLVGDPFAFTWNGHTADELFNLIRTTMPQSNPNSLPPGTVVDIIAYLFQANGAPAGHDDLKSEAAALKNIAIQVKQSGR